MSHKAGPRRCKVTSDLAFIAGDKNLILVRKNPYSHPKMTPFKDAEVRRIRNWLNWYLDNK